MDYLDRDAVLVLIANCNLEDLQGWDYEDINPEQTEAVRAAILWAVEQMSTEGTADVVEVVRCKDCRHSYDSVAGRMCAHGVCVDCVVRDDFYCSLGVKKDAAD